MPGVFGRVGRLLLMRSRDARLISEFFRDFEPETQDERFSGLNQTEENHTDYLGKTKPTD